MALIEFEMIGFPFVVCCFPSSARAKRNPFRYMHVHSVPLFFGWISSAKMHQIVTRRCVCHRCCDVFPPLINGELYREASHQPQLAPPYWPCWCCSPLQSVCQPKSGHGEDQVLWFWYGLHSGRCVCLPFVPSCENSFLSTDFHF